MENEFKYIIQREKIKEYKGHILHKIKAIKDFGNIKRGEEGGYIEYSKNLSQYNEAWIDKDSLVYGVKTKIEDNSKIIKGAICYNSIIYGKSEVSNKIEVKLSKLYNSLISSFYKKNQIISSDIDNSRLSETFVDLSKIRDCFIYKCNISNSELDKIKPRNKNIQNITNTSIKDFPIAKHGNF